MLPCTLVTWKPAVLLRKKGQASYCTAYEVKEHHLQWTTAPLKWYKHIKLRVLQAHACLLESMIGHAAIPCAEHSSVSIREPQSAPACLRSFDSRKNIV